MYESGILETKYNFNLREFHALLHKQLITLQKFNIPISIDILSKNIIRQG